MSKFEFKLYETIDGDAHIMQRLEDAHHGNIPNEITEGQLDDYHFDVTEVTTEKLLDKVRSGSADVVTEKNLNDAKGKFGVKNRNESAFEGDMNQVEKKRLSGDKTEDEKYEIASGTPKKLRWWEIKSPDGLKIASSPRRITAQNMSEFAVDVEEEENEDDVLLSDNPKIKTVADSMSVVSDSYNDSGRTIVISFPVGQTGIDDDFVLDAAMTMARNEFPELDVDTENFFEPDYGSNTIELYVPDNEENTETDSSPELQEGTITSIGSNKFDFNIIYSRSDKADAAFESFSETFNPDNLNDSTDSLSNIMDHSVFTPREKVVFLTKVKGFLGESGVSLDFLR